MKKVLWIAVMVGAISALAADRVEVHYLARMSNANHPQILYWFITPPILQDQQYLKDLDYMADHGPFDLIFLTARSGANFYDYGKMHPIFQQLIARAHGRGIRIGLQLWENRDSPRDECQGIVAEGETTLNGAGYAEYTGTSRHVFYEQRPDRPYYPPVSSELLRVFAFRKTAEGEYQPDSLRDITDHAKVTAKDKLSVSIAIDGSPDLAGYSAYVMTVHYSQYPDLFVDYLPKAFAEALQQYRDVGFDGAGIDEFRYMSVGKESNEGFRERLYTVAMANAFRRSTGGDLVRTLFDMRYAPQGNAMVRARAINQYFDLLREGPLRIEQAFAKSAREFFGPQTFLGLHDTFHNQLSNDEIWSTGINWWALPRDYGQTDERTPTPVRLGIGLSEPEAVEYNMFYSKVRDDFYPEAMDNARYNIRIHYHAYNDDHGWGVDLRDPKLLQDVNRIEDKIRLLNHFNAPRPKLDVLMIFGYPAQANWFPDAQNRNDWDINGGLEAMEKANALWKAGYLCALVASYEIDSGKLTADSAGHVIYGGQRFSNAVYIGAEYSKPATLDLLDRFTAGGGKLLLDGTATHDFDGRDITARFGKIAARASVAPCTPDAVAKLGVKPNPVADGISYEDDSVVLSNLESEMKSQPRPFTLRLAGHEFTGSYVGVLGIKVGEGGTLDKLAGGQIRELERDGKKIVRLSQPADLYLQRGADGHYELWLVGDHSVKVHVE
jgi:hypothetical protein